MGRRFTIAGLIPLSPPPASPSDCTWPPGDRPAPALDPATVSLTPADGRCHNPGCRHGAGGLPVPIANIPALYGPCPYCKPHLVPPPPPRGGLSAHLRASGLPPSADVGPIRLPVLGPRLIGSRPDSGESVVGPDRPAARPVDRQDAPGVVGVACRGDRVVAGSEDPARVRKEAAPAKRGWVTAGIVFCSFPSSAPWTRGVPPASLSRHPRRTRTEAPNRRGDHRQDQVDQTIDYAYLDHRSPGHALWFVIEPVLIRDAPFHPVRARSWRTARSRSTVPSGRGRR